MKKLLAIAVAAAVAAPAAVMADTTLYGKLHVSVDSIQRSAGGVSQTDTSVNSDVSRIGIKGSTELDNGLEATYGLEYGINVDHVGVTSQTFTSRNTWVGLKGGFGEVRAGRHDTPAKLATAGLDAFADTNADMSNIIAADGERVDNAVAYINKFGPVGFAAAHSTGIAEEVLGEINSPVGVSDANTMLVNYSNGPWYAGLGHTSINNVRNNTNLGLQYKAEAGHFANLVYETVDNAGTTADDKNLYLAGGYKMGNVTLKAGYGEGKRDNAGKEKQSTLGVDYSLGKKTTAYVLFNEDKNLGRVAGGNDKVTTSGVGLVHEF